MQLTTFLGQGIAQTVYAIPLWESLFKAIPTPARIIELGTGTGGFSTYLKLCCIRFWIPLYTYDLRPFPETKVTTALNLVDSFAIRNVVVDEDEIANVVRHPGRSLLYCDNGQKITEFRMYAKHLKAGDVIGAHDWGTEIKDADVEDAIKEHGLMHIPLDDFMEKEAYTKFFVKAPPPPKVDGVAYPAGVEAKF